MKRKAALQENSLTSYGELPGFAKRGGVDISGGIHTYQSDALSDDPSAISTAIRGPQYRMAHRSVSRYAD
jgi:hypothetical protein